VIDILDFDSHKVRERKRLETKQHLLQLQLLTTLTSKERLSIRNKLFTVVKQLQKLEVTLPYTTRYGELIELMKLENCLFTNEEASYYFFCPTSATGPGEYSYRMHHGLNVNDVGPRKGRDVPQYNLEIKSIHSWRKRNPTRERPWTYTISDFTKLRAGQHAADLLNDARYEMAFEYYQLGEKEENNWRKYYTHEVRSLINGCLSKDERSKLPTSVQDIFVEHLRPSRGLADCCSIVLTIPEGYINIVREEFDDAFDLYQASKGLVSYMLRMDYVRKRYVRSMNYLSPMYWKCLSYAFDQAPIIEEFEESDNVEPLL